MSAKNTVEVLIAGKVIQLSGYESEEYLQKVAAYLNHKVGELGELKGFNRMPADTKSLLLQLNIADDYFKAKKQAEVFEEDIQSKDKELYDLKHEIVSLQVQIDKMKRAEENAAELAARTASQASPVQPERTASQQPQAAQPSQTAPAQPERTAQTSQAAPASASQPDRSGSHVNPVRPPFSQNYYHKHQ